MSSSPSSAQMLAVLVRLLPVQWALDAPVGQLRVHVRTALAMLERGGWLVDLDPDAAAIREALTTLAAQGHGSTRTSFRGQLLTVLACAAAALAARVLADVDQPATPAQ